MTATGDAALFFKREHLLTLEVGAFNIRQNDRKFDVDLPRLAAYPGEWKERGLVDVVIVNRHVPGQAGVTKPPCGGQVIALAARLRFTNPTNVMNPRGDASFDPFTGALSGVALADGILDEEQIGDMHSSPAGVREADRLD